MSLLDQPEYVHVLLNHLPITGLAVSLLALAAGMVLRNRPVMLTGLGLIVLTAGAAWPVVEYGEKGYDRVHAMSDDAGKAALERHARLADRWAPLCYATAILAAAGFVVDRKWPKRLLLYCGLVALLSTAGLFQGTRIAQEGGEIRHREFRP